MKLRGRQALKRLALEVSGWILVVAGIAALVLPGPGLLGLFAGLFLLSQQYSWAERRVEPVKRAALKAAADGVATYPRIALSAFGCLVLMSVGVTWWVHPPAPSWWPVDESWWLIGGWATGLTIILSGIFALSLLVYSYRNFREVKEQPLRPVPKN
jgi:TctA family transporter